MQQSTTMLQKNQTEIITEATEMLLLLILQNLLFNKFLYIYI